MGISPISGSSNISGLYPIYNANPIEKVKASSPVDPRSDGTAQATVNGAKAAMEDPISRLPWNSVTVMKGHESIPMKDEVNPLEKALGIEKEGEKKSGKVDPAECETCKNRKYVDGSNEGDVSFKAPGHIDPASSRAVVMSHELEHVANARQEDAKENKELVSASITLQTAVCPECGRVYVSGGVTHTLMKTSTNIGASHKNNPYAKQQSYGAYLQNVGKDMDLSA